MSCTVPYTRAHVRSWRDALPQEPVVTSMRVCAVAGLTAFGLAVGPAVASATGPSVPENGPTADTRSATTSQTMAPYGSPRWQEQYEERLRAEVTSERPTRWMRALGANAAHVGTPGNRRNLTYAVDQLRSFGLDVEVDSYSVLATRPKRISVRQTAPRSRELAVIEDGAASFTKPEDLPVGYNAYSPSGTAAGDVVYVNYARPEDFAELTKRGISLKGKIALARYGQNFRGVKPDLAAKAGAVGMIIYSDPADDGFGKGEVYPDGPWRSADAIQRGSVLRLWDYPGDPLTPGTPSTKGAPRIAMEDATTFAPIPTTPISYGQARGLIATLTGPRAPKEWQGGLDVPYRLGGADGTKVALDLDTRGRAGAGRQCHRVDPRHRPRRRLRARRRASRHVGHGRRRQRVGMGLDDGDRGRARRALP